MFMGKAKAISEPTQLDDSRTGWLSERVQVQVKIVAVADAAAARSWRCNCVLAMCDNELRQRLDWLR